MNSMHDVQLVRSCLQGDMEDFGKIVDKYKGKIMALALNILANKEDAEDACQEAFIQAFRNLNRFNTRKSFSNWLYTILYNRCLDQLRKRRRWYNFFKKAKKESAHFTSIQTSDPTTDRLLARHLLKELSPKERATLFLWAIEGCTSAEIASVLNCTPSTARVFLFKARKKIKSRLEKENVSMQDF